VGLKEYRGKRDFSKTPEPVPAAPKPSSDRAFVVQKHAATNLHYDLRLQVGDVLKSWAIPKGPSLDPREKRLAIEVEDHPLEYADFEGTIPRGQYGGGTMMIWDRGRWQPESDPVVALNDGMMKFRLEGERLKGRWMLVRSKRPAKQPQWLLIKERDGDAAAGVHAETFGTSVRSGRSMDEIAAGAPPRAAVLPRERPLSAAALTGAREAPMPAKLGPQLAVAADEAPDGPDWLHEVKFDGYRLLIFRAGDSVRILSRAGLDWTARLPDIANAARDRLRTNAVLDGEAVLLDARGISDFQALQNAIHNRRSSALVFIAFDLPWCDGHDLTRTPLEQRRALLRALIGVRQEGRLRFSEHIEGNGPAAFARVCESGLEGIVSKRRNSPYAQSRTPAWVKVKCFNQQEFVIGAFSAPEGSREELGALLLGYYQGASLRFAGKVGTGFSAETLRKLGTQLRPLVQPGPPFANPPTGAEARGVTWVRPELVAQVQFRDWTADGVIRHTSFRGLRDDVDARSVSREPSREAAIDRPRPARAPAPPPAAGRLTHPERIVFPDRGAGYSLTKQQIAAYYDAVAPRMLPHVANRPLAILRCPDGEGGKTFFQKHPAKGMPRGVAGVEIVDDGGPELHLLIRDAEGLLGLVQMNALEFHPWGSGASDPERPDRLIFDLDPGAGVAWKQVVEAALMIRRALEQVSLRGFARVSGGKGVHTVVPISPVHDWEQAKGFTRAFAETLVGIAPGRFVATSGERNRENRIFIDYLRNGRGATAVAPYSTRARPGAPVALPVSWDELEGLPSGDALCVPAVLKRIAAGAPDPWEGLAGAAGVLPNAGAPAPQPRAPAPRKRAARRSAP
jgi:bifunctional non-homologous end joining protein LigD